MGEIIRRRKRSSKPVITTQADSVSEVVTTEESPFSTSSNVEKSKVKSFTIYRFGKGFRID